jgi:hypothetical protein
MLGSTVQVGSSWTDKTLAHEIAGHAAQPSAAEPDVYNTITDQPNPDLPGNLMNNDDLEEGFSLNWDQVKGILTDPANEVVRKTDDDYWKKLGEIYR